MLATRDFIIRNLMVERSLSGCCRSFADEHFEREAAPVTRTSHRPGRAAYAISNVKTEMRPRHFRSFGARLSAGFGLTSTFSFQASGLPDCFLSHRSRRHHYQQEQRRQTAGRPRPIPSSPPSPKRSSPIVRHPRASLHEPDSKVSSDMLDTGREVFAWPLNSL